MPGSFIHLRFRVPIGKVAGWAPERGWTFWRREKPLAPMKFFHLSLKIQEPEVTLSIQAFLSL